MTKTKIDEVTPEVAPEVTPEPAAPTPVGPRLGYFRRDNGVFFREEHPARPGVYFEKRVDGPNGDLPAGLKPREIPYE